MIFPFCPGFTIKHAIERSWGRLSQGVLSWRELFHSTHVTSWKVEFHPTDCHRCLSGALGEALRRDSAFAAAVVWCAARLKLSKGFMVVPTCAGSGCKQISIYTYLPT